MPRPMLVFLTTVLLFGCDDYGDGGPPPPPPPPAWNGGLALEDVGTFDYPVLVTSPPDDENRLFVVEKSGTIRIVKAGATLPTPFLDLTAKVSDTDERGLLGLAFHPDFATNRLFVVDYTDTGGDTRIVLYRASPADPDRADPGTEDIILTVEQPYPNHNGGMVAFGPDGHLYIAMGDGGSSGDPHGNGQSRATLLGKILRLAVATDGQVSIPGDNPFAGQSGVRPEIWSLGLRNPWRFSFDRETGDLYIADVGQSRREEINVVSPTAGKGANFGWNIMEGTACYEASGCDRTGLTEPVLEYLHADGCSITGGYVYRGAAIPDLAGTYFYGDYCRGWIRSFRRANGVNSELREWTDLDTNGQITSFGEDAAGELYVLLAGGRVARIVPAP